jgi:hypothetical protein
MATTWTTDILTASAPARTNQYNRTEQTRHVREGWAGGNSKLEAQKRELSVKHARRRMKNEASACCFIAEGPKRLRRGGDAPNSNSALAVRAKRTAILH